MIVPYSPELFGVVNGLAQAMRDEGAFKNCGWNSEKFETLLARPDVFCALVGDERGYYGGIIGIISTQFFSDDVCASDLGLFVLPEFRGGSAAIKLVKVYEDWAIANGAKEISLSQSTGIAIEKTMALYEHLGYELTGFSAKKEIQRV